MSKRNKILVSISIIVLFIISLLVSYAFFSARIYGNESTSTIVGTAAYLELTFSDGNKQINASNIVPGWSDSKTFSVENTGEETAYYIIKITDITNPFVYGGINYKIDKGNTSVVAKETLPLDTIPVTSVIEIPVNTTHEYTITTYYDSIEESQKADLGKSFSYTVTIEAVNKKEISYIEDLVDLSNAVNNGNTYENTWFLQTRDLDFNDTTSYRNANDTITYGDYNGDGTVESIKTELTTGKGFIPIGKSSAATTRFWGAYDGQNHRVDNLYIYDTDDSNTKRYALIGQAQNAVIQNITTSGDVTGIGRNNVAGVIGSIYNGVINNCHSSANVTKTTNNNAAGGLLATATGTVYIRNSSFAGSAMGSDHIAGVAGYLDNNSTLIIEKSHNEGEIINNVGMTAAGILGNVNGTAATTKIYNSYNTGNIVITRTTSADTFSGGICGRIQGSFYMTNSYNTGSISFAADTPVAAKYISGLVGKINSGVIINSYNAGAITGGSTIGGLIAYKNSTDSHIIINKCYNSGDIVTGYATGYLGGILGFSNYNQKSKTVVLNSYNTGNITGGSVAGGIFAYLNTSVYPINTYNSGSITSNNTASGIVGQNQSRFLYFNNVFNFGQINGASTSYGLYYRNSGNTNSITKSYYLAGIAGSNISGYTGTSKTSAEMASTDFVNLLNQNKRAIDLSTIYDGALADYADYELSDWKYDSTKGYPVLDN